jgi:lipopolysaccharide/colanic/teichoic acid biosynthesis glycosyltransferase
MSRRGRFLLFASLVASDALGVSLPLLLAAGLLAPGQPEYFPAIAAGLAPWLLAFAALRLYDLDTVLEDSQEYATVATGCAYGLLLLIVFSTFLGQRGLSLAWLFAGWVGTIAGAGLGRFLMRRVVRAMRRRGHLMAAALIVGADEQGRAIARQLRSEADSGLRVKGFVDDFLAPGTLVQDGLRVLGHPGALPALVAEHGIAEVVVVPGAMAWESFQQILEQLTIGAGPRIRLSPGYYDLLATTPRVAHRNFVPLFVVDSARLAGFDGLLKASVDYGGGLLLFVVTLPVTLVIGAALAVTLVIGAALAARGAFLVSEEYLGIGGRSFRARTFRAAPGGWLARTGLDRLPLLWAVLAGHMSLVGPRPIRAAERDRYRRWLPSLASVKPGVTGPWAVVSVAALEEEMRAVLYYIRNWTVWLDIQILLQSVLVILRRRWGTLG